jgi:putative restriction endonuclease
MSWKEAVIDALHRYSSRHGTRIIERRRLIEEELPQIRVDADARGKTPKYTLSFYLQKIRDQDRLLEFVEPGRYILLDEPIVVEQEDLPDSIIDKVILRDKLHIGTIPTSDEQALLRRRRGQERIRTLTLLNYNSQCALCDVKDEFFLVASHIVRWADEIDTRGNLANVMCLCRVHDALFEGGYISFADDLTVMRRSKVESSFLEVVLKETKYFRMPEHHHPMPDFLRRHRERTGFLTSNAPLNKSFELTAR